MPHRSQKTRVLRKRGKQPKTKQRRKQSIRILKQKATVGLRFEKPFSSFLIHLKMDTVDCRIGEVQREKQGSHRCGKASVWGMTK